MSYSLRLSDSGNAVFGEDGTARVALGPTTFGQSWRVTRMVVSTASDKPTTVLVYLNTEAPSAILDGSYTGNQDTSDSQIVLQNLDKIVFVWSGGTPGTYANATIYGEIEVDRALS